MKKMILIVLVGLLLVNGLIIGRGYVESFSSLLKKQQAVIEHQIK